MRAPIFQVDAFATRLFAGNPAAVIPLDRFPEDSVLQAIAAENNLAETAFLVPEGGDYRLRWFTPAVEVPLCGHATLASAAVIMERLQLGRREVAFHSASGPLRVQRTDTGYVLDFPARPSEPIAIPPGLAEALGAVPVEVCVNAFNYLARLESVANLRALAPDMSAIARLDRSGVIVTAGGRRKLRFHQPLLRAGEGHSGRSGNRGCALHAGPILDPAARPNGVSRFPGVPAGWGSPLSRGRRPRSP
jgi:predicted PhzF superfamily epimerase YddE/YHI9